jgi:hypothetical protein
MVKVKSVWPSSETFWMIMSTLMFAAASDSNSCDAMPGRSAKRRMAIFASFLSADTPETTIFSMSLSSAVTTVPSFSSNDVFTQSGTLYFMAISTERICKTLAPNEASSNISS